ncbi:MAG: serine hydrolase [Anaerolineales bacterium]|nr:MAG: serine hydrolase [Anaerolineales bacterium]
MPEESALRSEIDKIVSGFMSHDVVTSLAIGVIKEDTPLFLSYGSFTRECSDPPNENTVFEIGSITKTFTGTLLGEAVQRGLVTLDDTIAAHLPPETMPSDHTAATITLRQLATHTSGLPIFASNMDLFSQERRPYTIHDLYAGLASCDLCFEPGEQHRYSNLGMMLLGHVLELATGKRYQELLVDWICQPLGMGSTFVTTEDAQLQVRRAQGHTDDLVPAMTLEDLPTPAAGHIKSTADDMLLYLQANLRPGDSPLTGAIQLAQRVHYDPQGAALGWRTRKGGSHLWHTGQSVGFRCSCDLDMSESVAVVILSNTATSLLDWLRQPIMEVLIAGSCKPPEFSIPPVVDVAPHILARLTGTYAHEANPIMRLTIQLEGKWLTAQYCVNAEFPQVKLYPYSERDFFCRARPRHLHFVIDEGKRCEKLTVEGARGGTYVRVE